MESNNTSSSSTPKIIAVVVAILVCCSCIAIAAAGILGFSAFRNVKDIQTILTPSVPPVENTTTPVPTAQIDRPPVDDVSHDTIDTLLQTQVPENDPYELACRLQAICNVPKTIPAKAYKLGDKEKFWINNSDTNDNTQISATLRYITPHSYF